MRPMWTCPTCGRMFANRNQSHFCSRVSIDDHFVGREPHVVATFERLLEAARQSGPVTVVPEKTRIAFQVRMSFAAFTLRRRWIDGHVVLARRLESPRFRRIDRVSPGNQVHVFRLNDPSQVDREVSAWLAEAYEVGLQHHLASRRGSDRPRAKS
ncbi:MAG: DUF5655 domain-containing protein [Candidatus Dormibacterales bacterium]